jgi:hypothetical protein
MTFTLTVDTARFRNHVRDVIARNEQAGASVLPVIKGNGYGFTRDALAKEAGELGLTQICVGTIWEASDSLTHFTGKVIVLEPFNTADVSAAVKWKELLADFSERLVMVIGNPDVTAARESGVRHVWIEGATSMHRFGLAPHQIASVIKALGGGIAIDGFSVHLPIVQPTVSSVLGFEAHAPANASAKVQETLGWISWLKEIVADLDIPLTLNVSHLSVGEIAQIKANQPQVALQIRLGTSLWLGDSKALSVTGTVLAIGQLKDHERAGYQQKSGGQQVVVVSGGTAHGVAVSAPITTSSLRKRGIAVAEGLAQAVGKVRSPFLSGGNNLQFVEPPHMQVSLLWCDDKNLKVGDQLSCTVRNTTAHFDVIEWK